MGSRLRCPRCLSTFPAETFRVACDCGSLLDLHHDFGGLPPNVKVRFERRMATPPSPRNAYPGIWRFHELFWPWEAKEVVSLHEGRTPLYRHTSLDQFTGHDLLWLKHEGLNPTGSFKDRGMTVAVTAARRFGRSGLLCASTGNTAASLAAYGAMAGLPVFIIAPAGKVATGKIVQSLAFGAMVLEIEGDFDRALAIASELANEEGIALLNSVNPLRIEGQKTAAFEIAEAFSWDPPDWVVLPAGNLGNISAYGKGFLELKQTGLIDRVPRLAAIQAEGANPFYLSFREEFRRTFSVRADTVATAIRIGSPASFERAVRAIRETNGVVEQVSDEEILRAKSVVDASGIGCEPASAASVAGVRKLRDQGVIKPHEKVVAILTGNLLKDPDIVLRQTRYAPTVLPPDPARIREAIRQALRDRNA